MNNRGEIKVAVCRRHAGEGKEGSLSMARETKLAVRTLQLDPV
jgi:hypothetical protein